MLIINGVETEENTYVFGVNTQQATKTKTDDYVVTFADTGMLLVMNAGANNKTFTLPAADAAHIGCWFDFANIGTGRLTIAVAGSGVQLNGGTATTGTIYSDDDVAASVRVKLVSDTKWSIQATGTWSTT